MNYKLAPSLALTAVLFALCLGFSSEARAEIDLEVAALIGTGVDTGDADNNPYALQLGAVGELTINNWVFGVRGTRSIDTSDEDCEIDCRDVKGIGSFGGDLGYSWNILLLHIGPRLGLGYLYEKDGDRSGGYFEPGAVAEVELLMFVVGADLRYRVAFGESDLNGFLAYARLGLRF
jgi:hypothetical protein